MEPGRRGGRRLATGGELGSTGHWQLAAGLVTTADRDGFPTALDPDDGTVRWTADWPDADPGLVTLEPFPAARDDDHLTLRVDRPDGPDRRLDPRWLIDATTGEPVLDLTGWVPDVRVAPWSATDEVEILPHRYDPDADVTWLAYVDTDGPEVRVRDRFDGQALCVTRAGYALCPRLGPGPGAEEPARQQVWRLRE